MTCRPVHLTAISLPGTLSTKVTFDATPLICTLPLSAIWMFNEGVDSLSQGWKTEVVLRTLPVKSYKSGFDGFVFLPPYFQTGVVS